MIRIIKSHCSIIRLHLESFLLMVGQPLAFSLRRRCHRQVTDEVTFYFLNQFTVQHGFGKLVSLVGELEGEEVCVLFK